MKIINNPMEITEFRELEFGECFYYDGHYYMKCDSTIANAVELSGGIIVCFGHCDRVTKVSGEFVVK